MSLIPHTPNFIEVILSDRQINDTVIKQKAVFELLTHRQTPSGESSAIISVLVTMYATDGDNFGSQLTGNGFNPYMVELNAKNDTIVDATTGAILAVNTSFQSKEEFEAIANAFTQPVMLQGNFFEYLRDNQPIEIGDLIRHHITQADAMGRFS